MEQQLYSLPEVKTAIEAGSYLVLAGAEELLKQLPKGNWIAGTIPYFMDSKGACFSDDKIFVTDFSAYAQALKIETYPPAAIHRVTADAFENGFIYAIIPGFSPALEKFGMKAEAFENLYMNPLMGWIAGVNLNDIGSKKPLVFNGITAKANDNSMVALHIELPPEKMAHLEIINIFEQGNGLPLQFLENGYTCTICRVNNVEVNLADYLLENNISIERPLVADYSGAKINVSFQQIDKENKRVHFYAPVNTEQTYYLAAPLENYMDKFTRYISGKTIEPVAACNCILNYVYPELDGKKTGQIRGPFTFGEIGYILLNQTLVYLEINEK